MGLQAVSANEGTVGGVATVGAIARIVARFIAYGGSADQVGKHHGEGAPLTGELVSSPPDDDELLAGAQNGVEELLACPGVGIDTSR